MSHTMSFKTVGLLGGMGPQATVLLQQRIIDLVLADDDAAHVPLFIDMNPQVPSRLSWLLHNEGEDPAPVLAAMAKRLECAGAQAVAMPCNTAHHFASAIEAAITIPFLNVLTLIGDAVQRESQNKACVGILASPATRNIALFEKALTPVNATVVWPDDSIDMLSAIVRIKSKGVSEQDSQLLQTAAESCVVQGARCLLVGCSEFSLLSAGLSTDVPVIDSMDLLASAIHSFSVSTKFQSAAINGLSNRLD